MVIVTRVIQLSTSGLAVLALAGCGLLASGLDVLEPGMVEEGESMAEPGGDRFPDVLAVDLRARGGRTFDMAVTLSSPYDTPQRYADGWRVMDAEGTVLGTHTLLHDHANEQPFTRTQPGLVIPAGVTEIIVEGRDQANGYGGLAMTVAVPEP